ncbi:hypothetical protein IWQ62_004744 [Dispira parvispora]|uniref:Uncharacterized protein n=1 Tax=Dispira parvispora TaxID=1520584 RepID=A0A9W8ANH4_9FUNG|nr:hypothetical protein IWQ62_004744 [Dispira parvispora]
MSQSSLQHFTSVSDYYEFFLDEQINFLEQPFEIPSDFYDSPNGIPPTVLEAVTRRLNVELRKRCRASFNQQSRTQVLRELFVSRLTSQPLTPVVQLPALPRSGPTREWLRLLPEEWPVTEDSTADQDKRERFIQLRRRLSTQVRSLEYICERCRHYDHLQRLAARLHVPTMTQYVQLAHEESVDEARQLRATLDQLNRVVKAKKPLLSSAQPTTSEDQPDPRKTLLEMLNV